MERTQVLPELFLSAIWVGFVNDPGGWWAIRETSTTKGTKSHEGNPWGKNLRDPSCPWWLIGFLCPIVKLTHDPLVRPLLAMWRKLVVCSFPEVAHAMDRQFAEFSQSQGPRSCAA
jgi:hypothetical protein